MKTSIWVLTALCLTFLLGDAALAAPISFRLAGTIWVYDDGLLPPDLVTGLPFTARFTYDTSANDVSPGVSAIARYEFWPESGAHGLSVAIGPYTFLADPSAVFSLHVGNDMPAGTFSGSVSDALVVSMMPVLGPVTLQSMDISLGFEDHTASALSTDDLPSHLDARDFDVMNILIRGTTGVAPREEAPPGFVIEAHVQSVVSVPEPSTLLLTTAATIVFLPLLGRSSAKRAGRAT